MYYHAAMLLLFRPFLKATFTNFDVSPRDECRRSASSITEIFSQHRKLYGLIGIFTFEVHCLMTACTIHVVNLPTIAAARYLTDSCRHFHDLTSQNEWATGSLNIIKGLVQKWNIILPIETENVLYQNSAKLSNFKLVGPTRSAEGSRSEKKSHFLNPGTQVMQKRQRLAPRETRPQPPNYLFAPCPNQPAPILQPVHAEPHSDRSDADIEWKAEMNTFDHGFDGMVFGDDWYDPFMGYQGDDDDDVGEEEEDDDDE